MAMLVVRAAISPSSCVSKPKARPLNALGQRIAGLIAAQGPMSVAEFMTLALHDPTYGYYATRDPLGAGGDFITAPEISQTFGEMLGLWCVQVWHDQGKPKSQAVGRARARTRRP